MSTPPTQMLPPDTYTITSAADLASLRGPRAIPFMRNQRVRIEIDGLSADQARAWEAKLDAANGTCGCDEGALGALLGVGLTIAWYWTTSDPRLLVGLSLVLPSLVAGAVVGKTFGLARGRLRFSRTVAEIARTLESRRFTAVNL
jgi:hypothetical protein